MLGALDQRGNVSADQGIQKGIRGDIQKAMDFNRRRLDK